MKRLIVNLIIVCVLAAAEEETENIRMEAISMRDCLLRAIQCNLELEAEAYNPKISEFDVMLAHSEFDPVFISSYTYGRAKRLRASVFQASTLIEGDFDVQFQKKHILGGTLGFGYNIGYTNQAGNEQFIGLNPQWEHGFTLRATQPLLRNLGIDVNETQIKLAQLELDSSYYQFYETMLTVLADVQLTYWDLVNARQNYELQRKSLELAENLYKIQLERNRVGSLARADTLEAERNVAFKRDILVVAEQNIYAAEDRLKQLIRPLDIEYYKSARLIPTEQLEFHEMPIHFEEVLQFAMANRPDIARSKLGIDSASLQVEREKNQLLPSLDLSASVGYSGLGRSSSEAWKPVRDIDFPTWQVGVTLEIPLGNRAAKSRYYKALLLRKQLLSGHQQLESLVILEVRQAVRDLVTAMRRVETARVTRELAEKQLLSEENKFRNGRIVLFQVQETEQKLMEARIQEATSLVDYQKAIVTLYRARGALMENLSHYQIELDVPKIPDLKVDDRP